MALTYFSKKTWTSKSITFTDPAPSTWIITDKLDEEVFPYGEDEANKYDQAPSSFATFACQNLSLPELKGIMLVQMQIPYDGTMADDDRGWQASGKVPIGIKLLIDALKRLSKTPSSHIPELHGVLQEKQPDNSRAVPGGFIQYVVQSAVRGDPLGNGLIFTREDGRRQSDGLFWELDLNTRDLIRKHFQFLHRRLSDAQVDLPFPSLTQLFWDQNTQNLMIDGFFEPTAWGPEAFSAKDLHLWGLAIPPPGPVTQVDYNVPIDRLAHHGWLI